MSLSSVQTPLKKRKKQKTSISEIIAISRVSLSHFQLKSASDVVLVDESKETQEDTLVFKSPRSNLTKSYAPSSSRSPIMGQSDEAIPSNLPEISLRINLQLLILLDSWDFSPIGIANYLQPLVSELEKEKMEDLPEYCFFNEGIHVATWADILVGEDLQRSLQHNQELKAKITSQEREILSLKTELAKRMEELTSIGHTTQREAYSLPAEELLNELNTLKEFHWTKEASLDVELLQLNNELTIKQVELTIKLQRSRALTDLKGQEDCIALQSKFTTWKVWRYTLKQAKTGIEDMNAKIFEARELEAVAHYNLPAFPQLSPTSLSSFSHGEEEDPATPNLDVPGPSASHPIPLFFFLLGLFDLYQWWVRAMWLTRWGKETKMIRAYKKRSAGSPPRRCERLAVMGA
ncbi:hypothetical protein HAX54_012410 [Datura stramonium]|uniref:Uncharacterized protein n=1 Tax=Datura stramonium TaxID=4076 RepID=A0ABS8TLK4_DATST|nr:hypothetical protein [Datura stramonium]